MECIYSKDLSVGEQESGEAFKIRVLAAASLLKVASGFEVYDFLPLAQ